MQIETPDVEILIDTPLKVGEGPCWDDASGTLLFIATASSNVCKAQANKSNWRY